MNLKHECSFSLNMAQKTFEHNNSRDNILYVTVTLTSLYSDNLPSSISTKTPLLKINCTNYYLNSKKGIFHSREQGKRSFTARLTSMILQQYKIGFKVELKYIKVNVVFVGVTNTDEGIFFRKANDAINKYGK